MSAESGATPIRRRVLVANGIGDSVMRFRGALIRELVQAGHEVLVSTTAPENRARHTVEAEVTSLGATLRFSPLLRTSMNPIGEWRARRHYRALLRDFRPDAVLCTNPKPIFHLMPAAADASVPRRVALVTGLGFAFTGSTWRARALRIVATRLYTKALRFASAAFFQNEDDLRELRSRGCLLPTLPTEIVGGSGVDLDAFPQAPFPPDPPVFCMVARLLRDKGVYEFAEAARIVRARRPECRFRLVGWIDGNPAAIRRTELDAWIRDGTLEHVGFLDDVRPELRAASVFVLPSYREGTPLSTLEAMATGRPIITTDAPGCRRTVVEGENGRRVPARDAKALAEACLELAADNPLRERMGQRSRELAAEHFDVRAVNATIIAALAGEGPSATIRRT
jgi:glycosyltransferase involved in cell wall biosynthesis